MSGKSTAWGRVFALIRKETRQMIRDKSTLTLGIILPIVLLVLFGYGLSLDVDHVPATVVRDSPSPVTRDLYTSLKLSRYFDPAMADSMQEAKELMRFEHTDAIVRREIKDSPDGSENIQIVVNGRDANKARIMQRYLEGAIAGWWAGRKTSQFALPTENTAVGQAAAEPRVWYNNAMESRYFLVPGVIVLVMTLIGALLTALVIAREWERGTFEALISTPVRAGEFLTAKIVPYFMLGMTGLGLCLAASYWLFEVPMRGSLFLIVAGSALYLVITLGIGLFISSVTKSQFLASQLVMIVCFLPTLMLSGFIFDLNSAPRFVYYLAQVFPATWYVDLLQTLFLVGDVPLIVVRDFIVMGCFAVVMLVLARASTRKSLE